MRVGLFPFISICAMIPLIPSFFWDKVVPVKFLSFFDCSKWLRNKKPSIYHFRYGIIQAVFVLLCLFLVIQWNLSRFEQTKFLTAKTYRYTYKITAYLHLEQFWNMFSPPPATDGWYFLEGVGAQNNKVDVWNNKKEISINTKPKNVAKQYKTQRDRKFWETVVSGNKRYLRSISNYFCHKWNDDHNEKLLYIRTYYITEYPPPPFEKSDYELRRTSQMIMAYPCQYSSLPNIRR